MVVAHVRAVKIYVAAVEALKRKKERGDQNRMKLSLAPKIGPFLSLHPPSPFES
jgi:hypothetical protein